MGSALFGGKFANTAVVALRVDFCFSKNGYFSVYQVFSLRVCGVHPSKYMCLCGWLSVVELRPSL